MRKYSVGYLTSKDPANRNAWSGTMYQMLKSLKDQGMDIKLLAPLPVPRIVTELLTFINFITRTLFKKQYNHRSNIILSLLWKIRIQSLIRKARPDILFAPIASTEIAFLRTELPICYLSDSSFAQLNGYYPKFSNFVGFSNWETNYLESRALSRVNAYVYPSQWASDFVVHNYQVNPSKISIIKFGANINSIPYPFIPKQPEGAFNLLFLGVDWERKGGSLVYAVYELLKQQGHQITLTICGCKPNLQDPDIKIIPFVDKNLSADEKTFAAILTKAHVLVMPTRAECFGIVFSEASAFGVPSVTTRTGGVESAVKEGKNGFLLPMEAGPEDYAKVISRLIVNREEYLELSKNTRLQYEEEQNWELWGKKMKGIFDQMIASGK